MTQNAIQLLTGLHSELAGIGGHIGLAPADAPYPLVTYVIVSSRETGAKSFTSTGDVFSIQFSYWGTSFLDCLNLAARVEAILGTLSDVLQVSRGNLQMVQDTQKSKLFQCIDLRTVEILRPGRAWPTYTVVYDANGGDGYTTKSVNYGAFVGVLVADGTDLGMEGHLFTGWNTVADGSGTQYNPGDQLMDISITLYAQWELA